MSKKFYDDFTKLSIDKMAQSIVDMTYNYNNTKVPKKHYKGILEKDVMEMASSDINMEMCLLQPYITMLKQMNKENRKYLIKALLITELNIKDTSEEVIALSRTWDFIEDNKIKTIIDKQIIESFDNFKEYGNITIDDIKSSN